MSKRSKILLILLILACAVGFIADQVQGQREEIDNIDTIWVEHQDGRWCLRYLMNDKSVLIIRDIDALVVAAEEED